MAYKVIDTLHAFFARTFFSEIEKTLLYDICSHRGQHNKQYFMIGEVPAEKEFI